MPWSFLSHSANFLRIQSDTRASFCSGIYPWMGKTISACFHADIFHHVIYQIASECLCVFVVEFELLTAFKRDRKCKERYHSLHSPVYQRYFFWRGKEEIAWQRERIPSAFSFSILFLLSSLHFSRKGKNSVEKREGRLCTPSDFNAISPRKRESAALLESALAKCQNATLQNG